MRIVFQSEDRFRGYAFACSVAPVSAAPIREEDAELSVARRVAFDVRERLDLDGRLRLTLLGDLDLAVAETLSARLGELKAAGRPVRLDLSQLAFIDSSGVQALLVALTDARWTGWPLEVAPAVSPSVQRAAQVVGIAQVLWPQDGPAREPDAARSAPPGMSWPDPPASGDSDP